MKIEFFKLQVTTNTTKVIARTAIALIEPALVRGMRVFLNIVDENGKQVIINCLDDYNVFIQSLNKH